MIQIEPIGHVVNDFDLSTSPELIKECISRIFLNDQFAEGLAEIEKCEFLDVYYFLDKTTDITLTVKLRNGEERGVFATRSPNRPNHLAHTTVKLLRRDNNILWVTGLDALNNSPVLDIKCCDTSLFEKELIHNSISKQDPRIDILADIRSNNLSDLLIKAGQIHGHLCPGLALGVYASRLIVRDLLNQGKDLTKYTLTTYMQNCLVDGIMFITGATPGSKRFFMLPENQMRFTLLDEKGSGWDMRLSSESKSYMDESIDPDLPLLDRAFMTLELDSDKLFTAVEVSN